MQRPDQNDAHIAERPSAIFEIPRPSRFSLRQMFPNFDEMLWRNAPGNQKVRYLVRHEIPWTRNDNRVPAILQNVHQVLLEWPDVASPVKSNESCVVKADVATGRENLSGTYAGNGFHTMAASLLDPLEKLKSRKMGISHKYDRTLHSPVMERGNYLKPFDLILVAHRHDVRFL